MTATPSSILHPCTPNVVHRCEKDWDRRELLETSSFSFETAMIEVTLVVIFAAILTSVVPKKVQTLIPIPLICLLVLLFLSLILYAALPKSTLGNLINPKLNSKILQTIFFPPLVFSDALKANLKELGDCKYQIIWMVGPALVVGAGIVAIFPWLLAVTDRFSLFEALTFAGMTSATDPIAVIIELSAAGAPDRLSTVLSGESLMNDGVSLIIVDLFLKLQEGEEMTGGSILVFIIQQIVLGIAIGIVFGIVALMLIRLIGTDRTVVAGVSIVFPYLLFTLCLYYLHTSGLLALVMMGLIVNRYSKMLLESSYEFLQGIWEATEFIANNLLYGLAGVIVAIIFMSGTITAWDWLSLFCLYLWLSMARFVCVLASVPFLQRTGYGFSWKEGIVTWHGGMRGAIGLLISLYVSESPGVTARTAELTVFYMAGIVVLFYLNGATIGPFCRALGLAFDPEKDSDFVQARAHMLSETRLTMEEMGMEKDQASAALKIRRDSDKANPTAIASTRFPSKYAVHSHTEVFDSHLKEKRKKATRGMQTYFDGMLYSGLINRPAWLILSEAVEGKLTPDATGDSLLRWEDLLAVVAVKRWVRVSTVIDRLSGMCQRRRRKRPGSDDETTTTLTLEDLIKRPQDDLVENNQQKQLVASSRIDVRAALQCLTFAAWGLIVAHQRLRATALRAMFEFENPKLLKAENHKGEEDGTRSRTVPLEFQQLIEESERCCFAPAQFLNLMFKLNPQAIHYAKSYQGRHEIHDRNMQILRYLTHRGILPESHRNKLMEAIFSIDGIVSKSHFPLVDSKDVGMGGVRLLENPNFAPFVETKLLPKEQHERGPDEPKDIERGGVREDEDQDAGKAETFEKLLRSEDSAHQEIVELRVVGRDGQVKPLEPGEPPLVMKRVMVPLINRLLDQVEVMMKRNQLCSSGD